MSQLLRAQVLQGPAGRAVKPRNYDQQRVCQCRAFMRADSKQAAKRHTVGRDVAVELANTSFSSRKLNATVQIGAPLEVVWNALTDYENLGTFIPSLVENRCLERRPQGCLLYQVGAQDVAMGVKFSAACTLEIQEHPNGISDALCTVDGDFNYYYPRPGTSSAGGNTSSSGSSSDAEGPEPGVRDISFLLVDGDFQAFKGIWRMHPLQSDDRSTVLQYSLYVKPHPWLPVGLIQGRIRSEVVSNLKAVRRHTEHVYRQQQRGQAQQGIGSSSSYSTFETASNSTSASDIE